MRETYLAEYPYADSLIAFKAVISEDGSIPFLNPEQAEVLDAALDETECADPQARVIAGLYRSGTVARGDADALGATIRALDPAKELMREVFLSDGDQMAASPYYEAVSAAIGGIDLEWVYTIDRNGLAGAKVGTDGKVIPIVCDAFSDVTSEDGLEQQVAVALGQTHYAFQHELEWVHDKAGELQPVLLSRRQHVALGKIGLAGEFIHVATVLDDRHPARL